ncbi:hypothetical protein [Acuticoccus sp. I52.16.1]|uniref:hypothetical protein n=1 Tax=Acuticoccus sp. I52.16.1 TaxID=2928472 RepID=UPI001FD496DC|nr:hypothetical protein [Acuticoccus sp. I52.16.1]UOM34514.1 hypothetical protein MRB58_22320 [Acuticoccus sp. I52.16.1]
MMGYGGTRTLTALGSTVNVANRQERMIRTCGVELVASAREIDLDVDLDVPDA